MAKLSSSILLGLIAGSAAWFAVSGAFSGDTALLESQISELEDQLRTREVQLEYLRERRRVARIDVLSQKPNADCVSGIQTRLYFQELDSLGQAIGMGKEIALDGDVAYVEALVVKFADDFVLERDLLRGSSLLLFRRIFGEYQAPIDGVELDPVGQFPPAYSPEQVDPAFHRELWASFWDYALQPEVVRQSGVRAMHGEAPFIKLRDGMAYEVELRTSGGLTLRPIPGL